MDKRVLAGFFNVAGAILLVTGCLMAYDLPLCLIFFGFIAIVFGVFTAMSHLHERSKIKSSELTFTPISGHVVRCPVMTADALIIIKGKTGTIEVRCPNMDVMQEGYCTKLSTAIKERYCPYVKR